MRTLTGLDRLVETHFSSLKGQRLGVVCNQASIAADYRHVLEHLHRAGVQVACAFGPQHGLWGHTQDNMIEWEGAESSGLQVFSLYGEHREPTAEMLEGLDRLVIDLPDVGARYYTFIWTTALCLKACARLGIPVTLLDRPNPIGGISVEGTILQEEYASFVGLYPLPSRHGMTLGEIARCLAPNFAGLDLDVADLGGWRRDEPFDATGLPWAMPSPNMPTVDTAFVYPGGCLIEGSALSEGRGTTRPFEIVGAPYIDGWRLAASLNALALPGVYFRAIEFQPTFNKHAGVICGGVFVHVTDRRSFKPFVTYVAILQEALRGYGKEFEWKAPPYEYEWNRLPIDILAGNGWLRKAIEDMERLEAIEERCLAEQTLFAPVRRAALMYS